MRWDQLVCFIFGGILLGPIYYFFGVYVAFVCRYNKRSGFWKWLNDR